MNHKLYVLLEHFTDKQFLSVEYLYWTMGQWQNLMLQTFYCRKKIPSFTQWPRVQSSADNTVLFQELQSTGDVSDVMPISMS